MSERMDPSAGDAAVMTEARNMGFKWNAILDVIDRRTEAIAPLTIVELLDQLLLSEAVKGDCVDEEKTWLKQKPGAVASSSDSSTLSSRTSSPESAGVVPEKTMFLRHMPDPSPYDPLLCKVCMERVIDTVLLPCAHTIMCLTCSEDSLVPLKRGRHKPDSRCCPICRCEVEQVVKTFRA